jgi:DNA-binding NtrC family response regulator
VTGRILVVDDEPNLQELLRIVLEGEGYSVRQAFTYRDATTLLAHQDFDLVVCDIVLPDGNGSDRRPTWPAPDTRFATITAHSTPRTYDRAGEGAVTRLLLDVEASRWSSPNRCCDRARF